MTTLKFPVQVARSHVALGLINPTKGYPAGALNAAPTIGAAQHWCYQLTAADFIAHQLPLTIGTKVRRPADW